MDFLKVLVVSSYMTVVQGRDNLIFVIGEGGGRELKYWLVLECLFTDFFKIW